jgi:hypothetical protein
MMFGVRRIVWLGICCLAIAASVLTGAAPARAAFMPPSVTITATNRGMQMPATLPAGFVRVTFVNQSNQPTALPFFRLNSGVTDVQFTAALNSKINADAVFAVATAMGGVNTILPGSRQTTIVQLTAGRYVVVHFENMGGGSIVRDFAVQVASDSDFVVPPYTTQVVLHDYQITIPHELTEPEYVILRILNLGPSTHEWELMRVPANTTRQQIVTCIGEQKPTATCQKVLAAMIPAGGSEAIAPDAVSRLELKLHPGTYAALCYVPNMHGMPHAMLGMVAVFTVSAYDADGD